MRVLVVEDTTRLAESIVRGLDEEGVPAEHVGTGGAALERLARRDVDVVVLDLGLPDMDGLDVLARLRGGGDVVPVLVLTARDAVKARVAALEAGADDYVVKPFSFDELVARVRALARRAAAPRWAPLACGRVSLAPGEPAAQVGGGRVSLSPRERAFVELLLRRQGEALARKDILKEVFGYDFDPGTNVVDVHVAHLRKKLRGGGVRVESVRGVGYRLVEGDDADVE
jgi:DNA-binding response OmpR family regulator